MEPDRVDVRTTYPARRATIMRSRIIPSMVIFGALALSSSARAAIAPSKLGRFIDQNWSSDASLLRSLRKAGLVKPEVADGKLMAVFRRAREEDLSLPEGARRFNSPNERVRVFLEPYLTDKGRKWAEPLKSLDLPD